MVAGSDEYGPFGAGAGPTEAVSTSASVLTSPFDQTITSPTGDLEADSANPATSLGQFKPVTVGPGQTATIPVKITPTAKSGTTVSGTLYLDDASEVLYATFLDPIGDQVAAIPYEYTVK